MFERRKKKKLWSRISGRIQRPSRRSQPGDSPGLVIADPSAAKPSVTLIRYSRDFFEERKLESLDELYPLLKQPERIWLDVDGLGDSELVSQIGEIFGLHPLALEDVVNVHQRPKVEEYDEYLYLVARMPQSDNVVLTEQLSMFLKDRCLVTFQEYPNGDCFHLVRDRLRKSKGKIRERGIDYLAYSLIDAVIDIYYPVLEGLGELLEELESEIVRRSPTFGIDRIHAIKQDLLVIRRAVWPLREAINILVRDSSAFVADDTKIYLRDCYDHTVQLVELVESYREICADLRDMHLASLSNRLNEVMKMLTIISTFFIPLNFVASIYGMNFDSSVSPYNMPELRWFFGYPFALLIMLTISVALTVFFRRKGWLQDGDNYGQLGGPKGSGTEDNRD